MSQYIRNKSCDMCRNIEKGLVEMSIGETKHHLCYDCMFKFGLDVVQFTQMNFSDELDKTKLKLTLEEYKNEQ